MYPASRIARHVGASVFICSRAQLRLRHVRDARAHGLAIATYGINTPADLAVARQKGADAVITDFPERILRALRNS
jgi:glycerophosphoryl diester phosphodiesterase